EADRVLGARLVHDGVGEAAVHRLVVRPVPGADHGALVRDVTERPEALVGEAVIVALLLLFREPHAPDAIRGFLGRHHPVVLLVDRVAIGRAPAVRDPGPGAGAHDRLERGHQAARRALELHPVVLASHLGARRAGGHDRDLPALRVIPAGVVAALWTAAQRRC